MRFLNRVLRCSFVVLATGGLWGQYLDCNGTCEQACGPGKCWPSAVYPNVGEDSYPQCTGTLGSGNLSCSWFVWKNYEVEFPDRATKYPGVLSARAESSTLATCESGRYITPTFAVIECRPTWYPAQGDGFFTVDAYRAKCNIAYLFCVLIPFRSMVTCQEDGYVGTRTASHSCCAQKCNSCPCPA